MRRVRLKSVKGQRYFAPSLRRKMKHMNLQRAYHRIKLIAGLRRSSRTRSRKSDYGLIPNRILLGIESGMEVRTIPGKGRGIVATEEFKRGDALLEYVGEFLSKAEGVEREKCMAPEQGCYMFFFNHNGSTYCIDATSESIKRKARLVNHSYKKPNACMRKAVHWDGTIRLILYALTDIHPNDEILYDYGDRRKEAVGHCPWLKST